MGRPRGSRNRGVRRRARTPYQTYSEWYDKYTKGNKKGLFAPKLHNKEQYPDDKDSFEYWYKIAKAKGLSNPARTVAMEQEYVERSMERGLRKIYGNNMPDLSDKDKRREVAQQFVDDLVINDGLTESDAWEEFRDYFY